MGLTVEFETILDVAALGCDSSGVMGRKHISVTTKLQISDRLAAPAWAGQPSFVLRLRLFPVLIGATAASMKHESPIRRATCK